MRDFVPDEFIPEPDAVQGIPDVPMDDRIPEELVDAFFDGDLDEPGSREFIRELRKDAATAKHVVSTNSSLEALRRPVSTPDFTSSVLRTVEGRTPLLSGREFSLVSHWRAAAAICFLCLMTAAFVTQRVAPGAAFTAEEQPIGLITSSVPNPASEIGQTLNASFSAAQQFVIEQQPAAEPCAEGPTMCITTLTEAILAGEGTVTITKTEPARPACIDECGAMRTNTRRVRFGTNVVGAVGELHASDNTTGTVIVEIK